MNKNQKISSQADSIQSMINFLKDNPHKFEISICEGFLVKLGLKHEFNEIVECFMADWTNKFDMGGLNSFLSETNIIDITNRSLMKTIDKSRRKVEVKRATDLNSMLKGLEENFPQPSKHIEEKQRQHKSCPSLRRSKHNENSKKVTPLTVVGDSRSSSAGKYVKKTPRVISRLGPSIEPLEILYINEVTQAFSFQNLLFKSHVK